MKGPLVPTAKSPKSPAPRRRVVKPAGSASKPPQNVEAVPVPDEQETAAVGAAGLSLASVPPQSVAKAYVHRQFGKFSDFDIFDLAHKSRRALLIEGPTGPGKTMATRAWAATNKKRVARVPCNVGIEPTQLFGKYVPNEGALAGEPQFKWVDGPVTHVVRNGGVLLINEINFMPDRVATVLFGLLDANREIVLLDHEGEVVKAHDDLLIVADMNPDYEGTRPLNKAFRNRFGLQLTWDYDATVEASLVQSAALLTMAKQIRDAKGEYETPVSTNMLMEFEDITKSLDLDFAIDNFVNHFLAEERDSVRLVVGTHKSNIELDYADKSQVDDEDEDEDDDDTTPSSTRDTRYDPEWDIHGIDWVYADGND